MRCSSRFAGIERLEADEQAAEAGLHRTFEQIGREHRVDRACGLPEPAHAAHPVEECRRKAAVAEQVVVQEVEMAARQPLDFRQRGVDGLRVERSAALEERLLVAEVADVRTPARDDDRVRDQVETPLDQIAAHRAARPPACVSSSGRRVRACRAEVGEKARPRVLAGTEKDRVGVRAPLRRAATSRADRQGPRTHRAAVVIGDAIRAAGRRDVDLNDHQIRFVVEPQRLDVLVLDLRLVIVRDTPPAWPGRAAERAST